MRYYTSARAAVHPGRLQEGSEGNTDALEEAASKKERIVSQTIGAYKYIVKEVFEDAARAAIIPKERKRSCLVL